LAVVVVGLLLSQRPGLAADVAVPRLVPPQVPAPVYNWTGLYLGGQIGLDFGSARYVRPQTGLSDTAIGSAARGLDVGAYAGFNYQALPWLVLGVEGDYSTLRINYRELGPDIDFLQDSKHMAAVTGRVGVVVTPATMLYAKAGPAWLDVEGVEGFGTPFQKTLQASLIATGIETLVMPNVALRTEVSYVKTTQTLLLNQGFDQYRPTVFQTTFGVAFKLDAPPGWGATSTPAPSERTAPLITKAPPAAPVAEAHWSSGEIGGFVSLNGDKIKYLGSFVGENSEQGPYTTPAFGGGWFVGANMQLTASFVAGLELSGNHQKADFNTATGVGLAASFFHFASINEVYALSGRIGWLPTPSTLLYLKGGPALIRVSPDPSYWTALTPTAMTQPASIDGVQYGGGAETFLAPWFSVRVEGLYTRGFPRPGPAGQLMFLGNQPQPIRLEPSLLTATLGAAVHFW
jgi:outer membrane immunogenic protein